MLSTVRVSEGLLITVCRHGLKRAGVGAASIADIHVRVTGEHGALLLLIKKGVRAPILCMEEDRSADYPVVKFTPIT